MPLKRRFATKRYKPSGNQAFRARAVFTLEGGSDKELVGFGPRKRDAEAKLEGKIERLEREHPPAGHTATVTEIFGHILTRKKNVKRRKASTLRRDLLVFNTHIKPYIGDKRVSELRLEDLERVQAIPLAKGHLETARRVTQMLGQIFDDAMRRYKMQIARGELVLVHLAEDLEAVAPAQRTDPELWTPEQIGAFLAASEAQYRARDTSIYHPYFVLAIAAGLRRGELLGLPRKALAWREVEVGGETHAQPFIDVTTQLVYDAGRHYAETPKSASGVRSVPIPAPVAELLVEHEKKMKGLERRYGSRYQDHGLMFPTRYGTPVQPSNLYAYFYRILDGLGLPKVVPHMLRKTYLTYLTQRLIDEGRYNPKTVMRLAGHGDYKVTVKTYTLATQQGLETTALDPLLFTHEAS